MSFSPRADRLVPHAAAFRAARARTNWTHWLPQPSGAFQRGGFSLAAMAVDAAAIVGGALATGMAWHMLAYGEIGPADLFAQIGLFVAVLFVFASASRDDYSLAAHLKGPGPIHRTAALWSLTFAAALGVAFLARLTGELSRATILVFYGVGFCSLVAGRAVLADIVKARARRGAIPARRIFLVGSEEQIDGFYARRQSPSVRVVAAAVLRSRETLGVDLALASASARVLRPDDVYILAPWSQSETIDACVETFLRVPAAIHLGPERVLDKYIGARISHAGGVASLNIVRRPLSPFDVAVKRAFDIVAAACGLVLLAPLFALTALAIRLDSPGPVFFLQRRYGFNQQPFRIWKFRSMSTMDDGRQVVQARRDDPRVTRVGRFLRRTNIDELPQLVNVLKGDMSLVGPRPHAMAHDQKFDRSIACYARRHNVKPGITGWAQVNGCRGETDTPEKMARRIAYDLEYIDDWSFRTDVRILWMTVFSRRAYENAF